MAFQKPKKQPQFADLKGILAQTKKSDNPLYQTIQEIIERLTQFQQVTLEQIQDINNSINDVLSEITNINQVTNVINPQMPFFPDGGGGDDVIEGMMGPPGPRGATGPAGPSGTGTGAAAMPLWTMDEPEIYPEIIPLLSLANPRIIPEASIRDDNLLARVAANETITGSWSFNGADYGFNNTNLFFTSANPQFFWVETGVAADYSTWRFLADAGSFYIGVMNDARTTFDVGFHLARTAALITAAAMYTNGVQRTVWDSAGGLYHKYGLFLTGQSSVSLTAGQTAWNPTGLGTSYLFLVTPSTGGWSIDGILAQANGMIIVFTNVTNFAINFMHESASASAANRLHNPGGITIILGTFHSVTYYYDGTASRWRAIAKSS